MQYLQPDDFRNYFFISDLQLSPNGKNAALIGRSANVLNTYDVGIFIDSGDGFRSLSPEIKNASQLLWLDDENILFCEACEPEDIKKIEAGHELTCYYKANIKDGIVTPAFKIDAVVLKLHLLECGKFLVESVFDITRPCLKGKSDEEVKKILEEIRMEQCFQVIDELPFWTDGRGITNKKRVRLSILKEDGELDPITDPLTNVVDYRLSNNTTHLAYICDPAPAEIRSLECNIHVVNLATREEEVALKDPKRIRTFDFWNDKLVVSFAEPDTHRYFHGPFYIVEPKTKAVKEIAKFDLAILEPGFSDSKFEGGMMRKVVGDSYFFLALKGYHCDIFELNLNTGEITNKTNAKSDICCFDMQNGRIAYTAMTPGRLAEVFELKDGEVKELSHFNDEFLATRKYSAPEHFVFTDHEGFEVDGWVMKPVDYKEGEKYPAILNIHGGPKLAYNDCYFHEMQYWANQNYFVLFSNPRGSDGKGNEFADVRGRYGTIDYDNLMQFVDECIERYQGINAERLGVTGGSYGGFMTSWMVGHTDRFNAAVSQCSISNWASFYCTSDIGYYYGADQMAADPWSNYEKLWWHSPLKYAPNVKTPSLVLHSCEDFRCCIPEAYQWYTALKLHGVETKMVVFHGSDHEMPRSGNPDYRTRRLKEITGWMDKYLKA